MSIATFRLAREAEEARMKAEQKTAEAKTTKEPDAAVQKEEMAVKTVSSATASMKAKPKAAPKSDA
ncbi:MAG: hypothetical protein ACO24H_03375 [Polynucleobacter sp.]